jgi:outer membrane protein OmpA-like peptidoglycan-associated protein
MAGDVNGNTYVYDGIAWITANQPDGSAIEGISCPPSSTFCMVATNNGNTLFTQDEGLIWDSTVTQPDGDALDAVSCSSTTSCVVTDDVGNAFALDGDVWLFSPNVSPNPLTSISCPTADFCDAVDSEGDVFTYDGLIWTSASQNPIVLASGPIALTCPTTLFCLIGDAIGNVYANDEPLNDGGWVADPTDPVDPNGGVTALSCSSATSCVAADDAGHALSYTPQAAPSSLTINNIPVPATVGSTFTPAITTNSDGAITVLDTTSSVCSLSGTLVTFLAAGTCDLQATTAATAAYLAGAGSIQSITVTVAPIVSLRPQNSLDITTVSGTAGVPLTLLTSGGSGAGAVSFAVTSAGTATCIFASPDTLSATAAGSCTVTATKASDGTYIATSSLATQVTFAAPLTSPPPAKKPPARTPRAFTRIVGPFANNSVALGRRLASSVDALAAMAERSYDHRLTVTGYASSAGTHKQNELLSLARARVVTAALRATFAKHNYQVTVMAVGGGIGRALTPGANRVVVVRLR